jgi:acetyl esterase/lipase
VAPSLQAFIEDIVRQYHIDPHRVYLTGLSMGGYGTWDLAVQYPGYYAAVAPLCGGGNPALAYRLRDLPVWAFHGALDATVPVVRTQEMIDAIRQAGGDPLMTIYPNLGHDVWTVTYANPSLYDWLFAQSREVLPTQPSIAVPTTNTSPTVSFPAIPTPPTTSASGSSGGGGGAIDAWFVAALALLGIARRIMRRYCRIPASGLGLE